MKLILIDYVDIPGTSHLKYIEVRLRWGYGLHHHTPSLTLIHTLPRFVLIY